MRLALPILLLMATPVLAQPADKPFIYDAQPRMDLKGFAPPSPVTAAPPAEEASRPLPENAIPYDRVQLCPFNTKGPTPNTRMELGCAKPDAPKPPAKGVG